MIWSKTVQGAKNRSWTKQSHPIFLYYSTYYNKYVSCFWFLLSVFHITSSSAFRVKDLMLQFHGLSILLGTLFSEEKNYITSASNSSQGAHVCFLKGKGMCLQLPVILTERRDSLQAAGSWLLAAWKNKLVFLSLSFFLFPNC